MEREKIYIRRGRTDMRRGIDGLGLVVEESGLSLCEKSMFLFCGRKKDRYKVLYWDKEGYGLVYKRLEAGKLQWPKSEEGEMEQLTPKQLRWLLEGLSIYQPKAIREAKVGHFM